MVGRPDAFPRHAQRAGRAARRRWRQSRGFGQADIGVQGRRGSARGKGQTGTLLLDPDNITIQTPGGVAASPLINFGDATGTDVTINSGSLGTLLLTTTVELQAEQNITVSNTVNGGTTGGTLTLRAGGDIDVNAAITAKGLTLSANDNGGGTASTTGRVTVDANLTAGTSGISISNNGAGAGNENRIRATLTAATVGLDGFSTFTNAGVLSATNVNLTGGTITPFDGASIATTAKVDVATGATLTLPNSDITLGSLSGGGIVTLDNSNTLTTGSAGSSEFSGQITGGNVSSHLIKAGAATTFTLSGATNNYTSQTQVSAGTLQIKSGGVAGTGTSCWAHGRWDLIDGASVSNAVSVTNGASITNSSGTGTLASAGAFDIPTGATVGFSSAGTGLTVSRDITDTGTAASASVPGGGFQWHQYLYRRHHPQRRHAHTGQRRRPRHH